MQRMAFLEGVGRDFVFAGRLLRRSPGFTLTAVVSLACGIGVTTAVFSVMNSVLLSSLPVAEPAALVEVSSAGGRALSYPMYAALRNERDLFSGVLTIHSARFIASARLGEADAGDVAYSPVSADFFSTLGVTPALGRALGEEDLVSADTAVIAHAFWQRALDSDPGVLGKPLRVGRTTFTIVGVAPPRFAGLQPGLPVDVWVPVTSTDRQTLENPAALTFRVVARRGAGVGDEQARARLALLARQWTSDWHFPEPMRVELTSARTGLIELRRRFSQPLLVLTSLGALLLLVATANVAMLMLVRASARRREMGVRLSLGASRGRMLRQLLTESLLLGGIASALGLLLAPSVAAFLVRFLSSSVGPFDLSFTIDASVVAIVAVTSIVVVLIFGLAPALATTKVDLVPMLKAAPSAGDGRGTLIGPARVATLAEITLACVLLVGAVLFLRSLRALTTVDLGFRSDSLVLLPARTVPNGPTGLDAVRAYERVRERLSQVAGVQSAALASEILLSGNAWTSAVTVPGAAPPPGQERTAVMLVVSPGFFETMGTPLLDGRDFMPNDHDRAPAVAIVNAAAAHYFFAEARGVVGRTLQLEHPDFSRPLNIVGVVRDAKYTSLREAAPRMVYLPPFQAASALRRANLLVRTTAPAETAAALLQREAQGVSRDLRVGPATTQARFVERTIAHDRMLAQLAGVLGLAAVVLVCVGLYGLTTYDVSRRKSEIAVRLALGAQRRDVARMVMRHAIGVVAPGVLVGLAIAAALVRLVEGLLFGVSGIDAVTFAWAATTIVVVTAAAAYGPARRAARLDPIETLRHS